jgi:hypothetical protein
VTYFPGASGASSAWGTLLPAKSERYSCPYCCNARVRNWPIVLQKSNIAGLQIFTKNPKREAIADSYNLNRATDVAYEFNGGGEMRPLTSLHEIRTGSP